MTDEANQDRLADLLRLAAMKKLDDLETAWMAAIEDAAFGPEAALAVLSEVAAQQMPKIVESLAWLLSTTWAESRSPAAALAVVRRAVNLLAESALLREDMGGLCQAVHADHAGIATLVEMTLSRRDLPLWTAVERLDKLLLLAPGAFVIDPRRRNPGCVIGVDAQRKVLKVSFGESERGYDAVSIENVEPGDPEDYVALAAFAPDRLRALGKDDPEALACLVLKTYGPRMSFRDFKAALEPVIPAASWSRWWSGAKARVRHSHYIEMSDSAQPEFFLRSRPASFEHRSREAFDEGAGEGRLVFVLGYLKETGHDPAAEAELLRYFAAELSRPLSDPAQAGPATVLGSLAVLAEMRRRHPEVLPAPEGGAAALLPSDADMATVLAAVADDGLAESMLALVREALPERWGEVFALALPGGSPEVCEAMAAALSGAGHDARLAEAAAEIMRRPGECVGAAFWLWQAATAGRFPGALAGLDRVSLTIRLLLAADALGRVARDDRTLRPLVARVRAAVGAKDGGALRGVLEAANDVQAKDIRAAIERNAALTDTARTRAMDLVRRIHPLHFATRVLAPWEEEDVIYTTPAALRKQEEVYGELVTKKMMANSQAIGDAAARGDVSDNAEFTSALEEQQRLTEQAQRLQTDIAKARAITPSMASGDSVAVGSAIRARNVATGQEEAFTFFGPWDTDILNHIYYYRAPLALAFMGKKVGDVVTYGEGPNLRQWEVLEVKPGL